MHISKVILVTLIANVFFCATVLAQDAMTPTLNLFGTTGLIDMPTAENQPDIEEAIIHHHTNMEND